MKTCSTCKFWEGKCHEEPAFKRCSLSQSDVSLDPKEGFGVFDGEPFNGGLFATGPDFGCIHHEEKEVA